MSVAALHSRLATMTPAEHGFAWFDPTVTVGHGRGPLNGMIIPAKDLYDVTGMPTSLGSAGRTRMAVETDPFLQRLVDRGAIIAGKTQTSELGMSAYCEPVGMAAPSNPRMPGHTPGGSSGGAAVAVAQMLIDAAHASDGGGSIRVPAAACGLVGLKPAHNSTGGRPATQGFITRDVETQALLHNIVPVQRGLRIGVLLDPLHADSAVNGSVIETVENTAYRLEKLGHQVVPLGLPYGPWAFEAFSDVLAMRSTAVAGEASALVDWLRSLGSDLSASARCAAVQAFDSVHGVVLESWEVDVALMPTLAWAPPKIGHFSSMAPEADFLEQTKWTPWATMFNMTGGAALTMPSGVQLGGIRVGEAELLGLGKQLERD